MFGSEEPLTTVVINLFDNDTFTVNFQEKNKKRGRNKISAQLRRKQKNVIDLQTIKLRDKLEQERAEKETKKTGAAPRKTVAEEYGALARFVKKKS